MKEFPVFNLVVSQAKYGIAGLAGLFAVIAFCCSSPAGISAQSMNANADQFIGTWQAKFDGKVFVTLKLEKKDGTLAGTISKFGIEIDQSGNLTRAEAGSGNDPILAAKVEGVILRFSLKTKGRVSNYGDDVSEPDIHWEMKLTEANQAELTVVGAPNELAPWKLERLAKD